MASWNDSTKKRDRNNRVNKNTNNKNFTTDFVEITSDYKNPQPLHQEEQKPKPLLRTSKTLKVDAPSFIPKNSSLNKTNSNSSQNQDLGVIIQQDKFFFNNKFNLNSNNQNMMVQTLNSIPSQNLATLPQNPVINPYLNGYNPYSSQISPMNANFVNPPQQHTPNSSSSPIKPKLDINAKAFVKKKSSSEEMNLQSSTMSKKEEFKSPIIPDLGIIHENIQKSEEVSKIDYYNSSQHVSYDDPIKFNSLDSRKNDDLFRGNLNEFNSKFDMDSSNNFEEKNTSKENEIVEKILGENTSENESNNISSKDHETNNTKDNHDQDQEQISQEKDKEINQHLDNNINQDSHQNLPSVREQEPTNKLDNMNILNDIVDDKIQIKSDCVEEKPFQVLETKEQPIHRETENLITESLAPQKGNDNSLENNDLQISEVNPPENHNHVNGNSPTQVENNNKQKEESPLVEVSNVDNEPVKLTNHNNSPFEISDNNIQNINNLDKKQEEEAYDKIASNSDNFVPEQAQIDVDELGKNIPEMIKSQSDQRDFQIFRNNPLESNPFQSSRDYNDNVLTTENNDNISHRRENTNIFIEDQSFSNYQSLRQSTPFSSNHREEEFSYDFSKTLPNTKNLKINTEPDFINSELHAFLNSNRNSTISRTSRVNGKGIEKDYMKKPITGYRKLTSQISKDLNTCRASINSIPKITYLFDLNQPIIGEERLSSRNESEKISMSCDQKPAEEILINTNESDQNKQEIYADNETSGNLQNVEATDKVDLVKEKNEEEIKILEPAKVEEPTPIQEVNEEEKIDVNISNENKEFEEPIQNQEEYKNLDIIVENIQENTQSELENEQKEIKEEINNTLSNLSEKNEQINEEIPTETLNSNVETVPINENESNKEHKCDEDIQKPIQNEAEDLTKTDVQEPAKKEEVVDKNNSLTTETPEIKEQELKKEDSNHQKTVSFNLNRQTTMDNKKNYKAKIFKGKSRTLITVNTELKTTGKDDNDTSNHQTAESKYDIINKYFKVSKSGQAPTQTKVFNEEYINHFRNWKICKETHLIENLLQNHLEQMKVFTDEKMSLNNQNKHNKNRKEYNQKSLTDNDLSRKQISKSSQNSTPNESPSIKADDTSNFSRLQSQNSIDANSNFNGATIGNWARRNFAEAEKEAQEYKGKLDIERKVDPIKDELKEILNKSTLDNYDTIKALIYEKICDSIENQEKFMEVLFNKAIVEKSFVVIYARLCKDMDNELPQKVELNELEKKQKNITGSTIFRSKLIEKCRKIFKEEKNTIFENSNIDPEEREQKEKDFILGRELIKSRILSKNVVFQCLEHLQKNLEKLINIEGICMLLDKFGTEINKNEKTNKVISQKLNELNDKLDYYFNTLIELENSNSNLPGYIRYKIINLIEKKKRGWQESKVDQVLKIKSLKEVHQEFEQEIKETSPKNNNSNNSVQNQEDYSEYLNKEIMNDLNEWKKLKEGKKNEKNFGWNCIENLIKKEKYTLSMIFESFANIIIDFIKDSDDCDYCYTYIDSIFSYYKIIKNVKSEIINVSLNYLTNLNDYLLDNKMLIEVWVNILYSLINNEIFTISDFEKLTNLTKEQYSTIYEVSCKTVKQFTPKQQKQFFTEMNKLNFFKVYPEIFTNMRNN